MASAKKTVELFYDVVSPYAWIGFEVLCRYKTRWNIDLKLRPFFLGGVMQASGNQPPAMVPRKAVYMLKDTARLSDYYQIPLNQISNFTETVIQKGSLSAQRFLTAVDMRQPEYTEEISRQLWLRIWSRDEDITQAESLLQAGKAAKVPEALLKEALSSIKDQTVKDKLKKTTDQALDYGAFGAPTIVAYINNKPEMFFGSDRFLLLAHALGEKWQGPLPSSSKL
ncbi:hypothetical protein ScPMuIL_008954 [Solemya velum]